LQRQKESNTQRLQAHQSKNMPTTRKSTRSNAASGKQAKLTFNNRVTKAVPKSAKDAALSADTTPVKPSPLSKSVPQEVEEELAVPKPEQELAVPEPEQEEAAPEVEETEAEKKADKITDAQISKYWRGIEAQRMSKRVHQEDLSVGEKVLRYFDVSSQYGVSCVIFLAQSSRITSKIC
jgi:DNA polymerase delta subunit 4